ncbi:thermonuclease family protein [Arthrobacter sp. TMN-50]
MAASVIAGVAGCGTTRADAQTGEAVRIIDGDTLVINFENEDQTVRLLNVDTPETKHPDKAIECLGPESTAFLERTLPPGTPVGLDFDVEMTDQYDRVLAAVALEGGTLVNAEIARQGLGIAVLFEPNSKYFDVVRAAQAEVTANETGLYDPAAECTIPAEIERATAAVTEAREQPAGATAAAAAAAVGSLAAALASAKALHGALKTGEQSVRWFAQSTAAGVALLSGLSATIDSGQSRLDSVKAEAETLEAEEAEAKEDATAKKVEAVRVAEQERREATERAEAERFAAESAAVEAERLAAGERERLRNLPAPYPPQAPQPYVPPAPQPALPVVQPPPAVQDPFPGYTGPRCYAPGGKTWKPCP